MNNIDLLDFKNDNMNILSFIIFLYDNEYKWCELRKPMDQYLYHMIDYYNNNLQRLFIDKHTSSIFINPSGITMDDLIELNKKLNINIIDIINKLNQLDDQKQIDQYMIKLKKLLDDEINKPKSVSSITIEQVFSSFNL